MLNGARRNEHRSLSGSRCDSAHSNHDGHRFLHHMLEQLATRRLRDAAHLQGRSARSTSITPSRIAGLRSVRPCAVLPWARKWVSRATGFLLPMDEAQAQVAIDLVGAGVFAVFRPASRAVRGGLPTELVPHFFRSLAEVAWRCNPRQRYSRERAPHDRGLLQGAWVAPSARRFGARARNCRAQGRSLVSSADT